MNKALVTGAAGFIGFHLVTQLLKAGYQVIGLDNINDYYDVNLKLARLKESGIDNIADNTLVQSRIYDNYQFIKLDLSDKANVLSLFNDERFDYVINLAAQAGVRYSLLNPDAYTNSNICGFLNVLEGCRYYPVKHFIYASSSSVYGANTKVPFCETDRVDNPVSLYAATKKANELLAHTYAHLFSIPSTGLRFFTVYGPWGRPDMAYFSFTKSILEGKSIPVFNNGNMMRDFTYIDDITASIVKLLNVIPAVATTNSASQMPAPYTIYNIGASSPVRLMDFIHEIELATNTRAKLEYLPMQPGDVPATYADVSKLEKAINSYNKVSLHEGIPKFIKWYRNYYKMDAKQEVEANTKAYALL